MPPRRQTRKLHSNIRRAYARLLNRGGLLCRQFSESEDALKRGGHYIYFTYRDSEKFPTGAGLFLIENGLVESCGDGLFEETPQTFRAVPAHAFEEFRQKYESLAEAAE